MFVWSLQSIHLLAAYLIKESSLRNVPCIEYLDICTKGKSKVIKKKWSTTTRKRIFYKKSKFKTEPEIINTITKNKKKLPLYILPQNKHFFENGTVKAFADDKKTPFQKDCYLSSSSSFGVCCPCK